MRARPSKVLVVLAAGGNAQAGDLVTHELGHSVARLADGPSTWSVSMHYGRRS